MRHEIKKLSVPAIVKGALLESLIMPEVDNMEPQVLRLTGKVFGPGRFAKTAERLRENNSFIRELSFVALCEGELVGSVRLWPLKVMDCEGRYLEGVAFLGPIVVDERVRSKGLGKALIFKVIAEALRRKYNAILLVGDREYFTPMGFEVSKDLQISGPIDSQRLLVRILKGDFILKGKLI